MTRAIHVFFADSEVPVEAYAPLVAEMPGCDPDDRVHTAAAVAGGASSLITWNRKDFPAKPLAKYGLEVVDPDTYLSGLFDEFPDETTATVVRMAAAKRRPPISTDQLLSTLATAGIPGFVALVRQQVR